jgi:hypothetical protein
MRRRLLISTVLATLALPCAATAEHVEPGNLNVGFSGNFAPKALPRHEDAPITIKVEGRIGTTDGSHPPPLKRLEIALNRHGSISTRGLKTCRGSNIQSTSTAVALARCRPALVGRGSFHTTYELGGNVPSNGKILAFNSRQSGKPALLLHLAIAVPVQATLVLPLSLRPTDEGEFGTVLEGDIPKLAGGLGSITRIALHIGRVYYLHGKRRSYVSASCSAPAGLNAALFQFLRGRFTFAGQPTAQIKLLRGCHVG